MNRRLCIGVYNPSTTLTELLRGIGVWFEGITTFENLEDRYSVVIIENDTDLSSEQLQQLSAFRANKGALLQIANQSNVVESKLSTRYVKRLWNQSDHSLFDHIPYFDVFQPVALCQSSTLFEGFVHFEESNFGFIGIDVSAIEFNGDSSRKYFPSSMLPHPDELVAKLALGTLQNIIYYSLFHLHLQLQLPLITKWRSPSIKPYFGFRIDSDFGSKSKLDELYKLLNTYQIKGTWFLHVRQHEDYLDHLKTFDNQELAFHGYEHGTSTSPVKTSINLNKGMDVLIDHGIRPHGYCAPYGIWNKTMWETIQDFDLQYLSDFSISYNALPHSISNGKQTLLQIPIHPICTGSLSRKRHSLSSMEEYFKNYITEQYKSNNPIMLYHHPMQKGLEVLQVIFEWIQNMEVPSLSFSEINSYWKQRNAQKFESHIRNGKLFLHSESESNLLIGIHTQPQNIQVVEARTQEITSGCGENVTLPISKPYTQDQIRDLKGNRLALLKTSIIDWKNRVRL